MNYETPLSVKILCHLHQYPGQALTEDRLAIELNCSVVSVRGALSVLINEGLVLLTHVRGGQLGFVVEDINASHEAGASS